MIAAPPPGTLRSVGGRLERRGACLVVASPDGILLPLWPPGTRIRGDRVILPNSGWRRPPEIGGVVGLEGRFVFASHGPLHRIAGPAAACASRRFLVSQARRIFVATNAIELAADSDAVVVIRADSVDTNAPASDGFRTTIAGRVIESLKGPYRPGEAIRVRHVHGAGSPILAHAPQLPAPGETMLLFVSRESYFGQAEARRGTPLPGHVGAGGGLFLVRDGQILNSADIQMPATLAELRAQLGG